MSDPPERKAAQSAEQSVRLWRRKRRRPDLPQTDSDNPIEKARAARRARRNK